MASQLANNDVSTTAPNDARPCGWCKAPLSDPRARYCHQRCRQTAWRARRHLSLAAAGDRPMRLAYADPPYPGLARRYYRDEPTYAGEVDHRALIASLKASYDGWALSTSAAALQELLPLCPPGVRVCAWTKPGGVPPGTRGPHNTWEVVIVKPARRERPGVRDSIVCHPARGGGSLPGRKPIAFVRWVIALLGARRGDELVDLYPGTGVVGRVWAEVSGDTSPRGMDDGRTRPSGQTPCHSAAPAGPGARPDHATETPPGAAGVG